MSDDSPSDATRNEQSADDGRPGHPELSEEVKEALEAADDDELPEEAEEIPEEVRERYLRETRDDEAEQRHREAERTANPDDHRDEPPHES